MPPAVHAGRQGNRSRDVDLSSGGDGTIYKATAIAGRGLTHREQTGLLNDATRRPMRNYDLREWIQITLLAIMAAAIVFAVGR